MKFLSRESAQLFLLEIGRADLVSSALESFVPDSDLYELFIKGRRALVPKLKNFRRSQAGKAGWRKSRYKHMKGIKSYHKSTEGKRFHRNLGRFIASRELKSGRYKREALDSILVTEVSDFLKALSSLKTHIFIELDYYHPVDEEVDLHIFLEEAIPVISRVEKALIDGTEILEDDLDFLISLINPNDLLIEISELYKKPLKTVEEDYNEIIKSIDMDESGSYLKLLNSLKSNYHD